MVLSNLPTSVCSNACLFNHIRYVFVFYIESTTLLSHYEQTHTHSKQIYLLAVVVFFFLLCFRLINDHELKFVMCIYLNNLTHAQQREKEKESW